MPERQFVVCDSFVPTMCGWICVEPSDSGLWVFVAFDHTPRAGDQYLVEITGTSQSGRSRLGRVLWCVDDVLWELVQTLSSASWYRDHNGDPCVREINVSVGTFDAYYTAGRRESGVWWDYGPCITFVPARDSPLWAEREQVARWLKFGDMLQFARAEEAPFAPGIIPAVGKGQLVAERLRRHLGV